MAGGDRVRVHKVAIALLLVTNAQSVCQRPSAEYKLPYPVGATSAAGKVKTGLRKCATEAGVPLTPHQALADLCGR